MLGGFWPGGKRPGWKMAWVDFGWVENGTNFGWKTAGGFRRVEKGWVDFGRVDFGYHRGTLIDQN